MAPPDPKSSGKAAGAVLVAIIVVALGGAVTYLLAEINSHRYRLTTEGQTLVVERGRHLPWGFEPFTPEAAELAAAYAPIPIPAGETLSPTEVYDDRVDVDRALFALFAGWTRARLKSIAPGDFELAAGYVRRSEILPGLSEQQRVELKRLRADVAYGNGRRIVNEIGTRLQQALAEFKLARELGPTEAADAARWAAEIERRLNDYRDVSPTSTFQPPPPRPPLPAEAPETPPGLLVAPTPQPATPTPAVGTGPLAAPAAPGTAEERLDNGLHP
ncbi:MAG: hypothetical protein HY903_12895 [Deltaproteobacteria bacterium]|nr:hypothetical protein [Deltaproteobacteria bacterium]